MPPAVLPVPERAFCLGVTPITNLEYAAFIVAAAACEPPWWSNPAYSAPAQPAVGVTWFEAVAFCDWLSEEWGGRWRLPFAAEWEWAARGGLVDAPTAWGERIPPGEVPTGKLDGPWRVGRGTANGYGLLDMGTIVHEWCLDLDEPSGGNAPRPRAGTPTEGRRVSCGGSWRHHVRWSPPAARSSLPPSYRYADYGFRVLREEP
jgi:sulfatase modifying factor 1